MVRRMLDNLHFFSTLILTAHWLIVIGLSLRVIARRLPVGVSLAWLSVVFSVPFAGAAAYLFFGGKRLGGTRIARQSVAEDAAKADARGLKDHLETSSPARGDTGYALYRQTLGLMGIPSLSGNQLCLLHNHEAVFEALIEDIKQAKEGCRLAFYIWHEGGRADEVLTSILEAQGRGVICQILVDAVGSAPFLKGKRIETLLAAGIKVVGALPSSFGRRADLRYHRKTVVIDGRVAYTGSQNLGDPRFFKQASGVGTWVDAVVRIEGPAVTSLAKMFAVDWSIESGEAFEAPKFRAEPLKEPISNGALLQVVPSGPTPYPDGIRQLLLTAIYSARQSITMTTPYFVPDEAILTALLSAA